MRAILTLMIGTIVACGGDGGGSSNDANNGGGDGNGNIDAAPAQIIVSGQANALSISGSTPTQGVLVEAFKNSDENTPITSATSDAQGNFSLTITTNGVALDGYLKATKSGFKVTYLYPPEPLAMDFNMAAVKIATPSNYDFLSTLAQGQQTPGNALIAMIVTDGTNPVAGATVSATPAALRYRYNAGTTTLLPSSTATATATDGIAYMFNVTPGQVSVSAAKSGSTFRSHGLKAWADELTTTLVIP